MSLKLNERYPGRFNNPDADYPQGSFKNRTAPGAKDGSYLEKDWANDKEGFFQSLLSAASITANGLVDKVGASQYYSSLLQIINSKVSQATESVLGVAKIATQALVDAGVDDATIVTPKKMRNGVAFSHGATSYRKTPDWLDGGTIEAWGQATTASNGRLVITLPLAMANTGYTVQLSGMGTTTGFSGWANEINTGSRTTSTFEVGTFTSSAASAASTKFQWRVIGEAP